MARDLWWMEPARPGKRRRAMDSIVAFGVSAILGLAAAEEAGRTVRWPIGATADIQMPAEAWQYGLWCAVCVAGGLLGAWIMGFGGRAEITLQADGVQWLLGRQARRFFPYARMQHATVSRDAGGTWILRILMRSEAPGGEAVASDMRIAPRIDPERVRATLRAAGVTVA